jgi:hypothetical protein
MYSSKKLKITELFLKLLKKDILMTSIFFPYKKNSEKWKDAMEWRRDINQIRVQRINGNRVYCILRLCRLCYYTRQKDEKISWKYSRWTCLNVGGFCGNYVRGMFLLCWKDLIRGTTILPLYVRNKIVSENLQPLSHIPIWRGCKSHINIPTGVAWKIYYPKKESVYGKKRSYSKQNNLEG